MYTDGWLAYDGLATAGCHHHRICREANEFARDKNHVDGIESFGGFAKARLAKQNVSSILIIAKKPLPLTTDPI